MSNKRKLRRTIRWILSVMLVVVGLSTTWAWGRVARLAEPAPEDAGPQPAALYAAWQPSGSERLELFRSTDDAATWQPLGLSPVTWSSDGGDRLAAFSDTGSLLLSADRGDTWTQVGTDLPVVSMVWGEQGALFLGTDGYGLYRLDGGEPMASLAVPGSELATSPVRHLAYADGRLFAATPTVLFTSDDGGATWAKSLPVAGGRISALAAVDRDTVFVGTETVGVSRSTDGGRTWEPALQGLGLAAGQLVQVTALQADSQERGVLYVAVDYLVGATQVHDVPVGTFVTVDNGSAWEALSGPGFPQVEHASALVVAPDRPLYVESVAAGGLQSYAPDIAGALAALDSTDTSARLEAIRLLGMARAQEAGQALLSAVADPNLSISVAAAEALGRIDDPETASGLLVALDHPNEQVQISAARALGMMGVKGAVPALRTMLMNGDGAAINAAAQALGRIGSPEATDALLAAVADPEMTPRRHAALAALESIGEPAVGSLVNMLSSSDPYARSNAAQALGWIGSPSATKALIETLDDKSSLVRSQAAWALGEVGDPSARAALQKVQQNDASAVVQEASARSLANLEQRPATRTSWVATLAPALNRFQALRWLLLAASLMGAALLAATNTRVPLAVFQQINRR
jgi:HEAT repeat protein